MHIYISLRTIAYREIILLNPKMNSVNRTIRFVDYLLSTQKTAKHLSVHKSIVSNSIVYRDSVESKWISLVFKCMLNLSMNLPTVDVVFFPFLPGVVVFFLSGWLLTSSIGARGSNRWSIGTCPTLAANRKGSCKSNQKHSELQVQRKISWTPRPSP